MSLRSKKKAVGFSSGRINRRPGRDTKGREGAEAPPPAPTHRRDAIMTRLSTINADIRETIAPAINLSNVPEGTTEFEFAIGQVSKWFSLAELREIAYGLQLSKCSKRATVIALLETFAWSHDGVLISTSATRTQNV